MTNPFTNAKSTATQQSQSLHFVKGIVRNVPDDDSHVVTVQPRGRETTFPASVGVSVRGDVNVPSEGTNVLCAFIEGGLPFVVSSVYTSDGTQPPTYTEGERYVGHDATDATIHFDEDGVITLEGTGDATVTLDDDVIQINGGTVTLGDGDSGVITDISTSTDGDGHVTDVTPVRSEVVEVG